MIVAKNKALEPTLFEKRQIDICKFGSMMLNCVLRFGDLIRWDGTKKQQQLLILPYSPSTPSSLGGGPSNLSFFFAYLKMKAAWLNLAGYVIKETF